MIRWRTSRAAGAAPPDSRSHHPVLTMLIAALAALAALKLGLLGHDLSSRSSATSLTSLARAGPPDGPSTTLPTLPEPAAGPGRSAGLEDAAGRPRRPQPRPVHRPGCKCQVPARRGSIRTG
jgi:hypothetical protein